MGRNESDWSIFCGWFTGLKMCLAHTAHPRLFIQGEFFFKIVAPVGAEKNSIINNFLKKLKPIM